MELPKRKQQPQRHHIKWHTIHFCMFSLKNKLVHSVSQASERQSNQQIHSMCPIRATHYHTHTTNAQRQNPEFKHPTIRTISLLRLNIECMNDLDFFPSFVCFHMVLLDSTPLYTYTTLVHRHTPYTCAVCTHSWLCA